jgi:hypothetical protein
MTATYEEQQTVLLQFNVGNVHTVTFAFTDPTTGDPLDLTGYTVELIRKADRYLPDSDPSTIVYTATVSTPTSGVAVVDVPAADNAAATMEWWRVDLVSSGDHQTVQYGPLDVVPV